MTVPALSDLPLLPYLDDAGQLSQDTEGKIGVYAIFDADQQLQYVGYSRNVYLSLKQHLVRQPQACYGVKVYTIAKPSRSLLEDVQTAWIAAGPTPPPGNVSPAQWTEAIDAKAQMTPDEAQQLAQTDDIGQSKVLKNVARRVEAEIKAALSDRGVTMDIRFNPKLKEAGLLDLKP